jgi:hypothetical protein
VCAKGRRIERALDYIHESLVMGWRWRKSIGLPGGSRATVSSGGVGFSWGFPGLRIGRSPSGNVWISISIPGTGISFVKYLPSFHAQSTASTPSSNSPANLPPTNNQAQSAQTPNQRLLEEMKKMP